MAKRRANGEGSIRKRKDGCWEGRYTAGRDPVTGKAIYKNVLGKTQAEVKAKLKPAIEKSGVQFLRTEHYTVANGWTPGWRTMPSCKFDPRPTRPTRVLLKTTSSLPSGTSLWKS